jgi:hypothetical protein
MLVVVAVVQLRVQRTHALRWKDIAVCLGNSLICWVVVGITLIFSEY